MRPASERKCKLDTNKTCGIWIAGEWSECSGTCGNAARYREVKCANGDMCSSIIKPHEIEICLNNPPCQDEDLILADLILKMNKVKKRNRKNVKKYTENIDHVYLFNLINYTQNFEYYENLTLNETSEYEWNIGEFSEVL